MKPLYFEKSLSIDIREESIAISLLGKQFRSVDPLGFHFGRIEPLKKDDEKSEKLFLDKISDFLMLYDANPDSVVISLPRSLVAFKSFDLPAPDRKTIDSMIGFELEKHCAASPEDMYYSFHVTEKSKNLFHIVLSAVKKDVADYYLQLIRKLNLMPTSITVSTFSNLNLIRHGNGGLKERVAILVDLGSKSVDISIVKDGAFESSRNVPIIDPEFSSRYFAENVPAEYRERKSEKLANIIITEIESALASCNNILPEDAVEKIYIFGGGQFAEPLALHIEKQSEVTSVIAHSPIRINGSFEYIPSLLETSLSMGLRELKRRWADINILPPHLRPKKKTFNIKTTLGLAAGVAFLLIGVLVAKVIHGNVTLSSLEKQLQELKEQAVAFEKIDMEYAQLQKPIEYFKNIDKSSPLKLPALEELSQVLPNDTWLTDISISKDKLEIKGFSSSASKLIGILENSALFKDTAFSGSIVTQEEGDKFTIRATLEEKP